LEKHYLAHLYRNYDTLENFLQGSSSLDKFDVINNMIEEAAKDNFNCQIYNDNLFSFFRFQLRMGEVWV